jgi:hypothetical protein
LLMHDFPDPGLHSPQRMHTTTPLQGLYVLNSPFVMEQARLLVDRLQREAPDSMEARVDLAHQLLFARRATPAELELARSFLEPALAAPSAPAPADDSAESSEEKGVASGLPGEAATPRDTFSVSAPAPSDMAWVQYAHALLGSNEFLFVD